MLTTDVHCRVGGPTSLLTTTHYVECCHFNTAVHISRHLDLQFERELARYSWFVCNTFSLGTCQT
jgi:hypothetical protein